MSLKKFAVLALLTVIATTSVAATLAYKTGYDLATSVVIGNLEQGLTTDSAKIELQRALISPLDPLPSKNDVRAISAQAINKKSINSLSDNSTNGSSPIAGMHPCQLYSMAMMIFMDEPVAYEYQMPRKWFYQQCMPIPKYEKTWNAISSCLSLQSAVNSSMVDDNFKQYASARFKAYCQFNGPEELADALTEYSAAKGSFCRKSRENQDEDVALKPFPALYYQEDCQ